MSVNNVRRHPNARQIIEEIGVQTNTNIVLFIYIFAVVLWLFIIYAVGIYKDLSLISGVILLIPIVIFIFGIVNASQRTTGTPSATSQIIGSFYLPFSLLIVVPLLTWISRDFTGDKKHFITITVLAVIIILLSVIDIWVRDSWIPYVAHFRSIMETIGITLIILALYLYIHDYVSSTKSNKTSDVEKNIIIPGVARA